VGSLERWRERIDVAKSTGEGLPEGGLKLAACRQGLWEATLVAGSSHDAEAVLAGLERRLARALETSGATVSGRVRHGLRLALTWLREEMAKDPDHA
jgi:hypothetical protein